MNAQKLFEMKSRLDYYSRMKAMGCQYTAYAIKYKEQKKELDKLIKEIKNKKVTKRSK